MEFLDRLCVLELEMFHNEQYILKLVDAATLDDAI